MHYSIFPLRLKGISLWRLFPPSSHGKKTARIVLRICHYVWSLSLAVSPPFMNWPSHSSVSPQPESTAHIQCKASSSVRYCHHAAASGKRESVIDGCHQKYRVFETGGWRRNPSKWLFLGVFWSSIDSRVTDWNGLTLCVVVKSRSTANSSHLHNLMWSRN